MTNFNDLNFILDTLTAYFTGDRVILALFILFIFFIGFIAAGLRPELSLVMMLPLAGFFLAIGYFGLIDKSQWIVNLGLVAVGVIYGWAIIKIMS